MSNDIRETIFIYALTSCRTGKVLYVGQTNEPNCRQFFHAHRWPRRFGKHTFRVLRTCTVENAYRLEAQIIKAHWRRGECQKNIRLSAGTRKPKSTPWVRWIEANKFFVSVYEAAFHLKASKSTVARAVKTRENIHWIARKRNTVTLELVRL